LSATPHDAEEVLQETFLEVVRSIGRYRGDGSFAGWVRQVAASKALGRLRYHRVRAGETSLDTDEDGEAPPEPPVEPVHRATASTWRPRSSFSRTAPGRWSGSTTSRGTPTTRSAH